MLEALCSQTEARWFYWGYSWLYEWLQPYFTSDEMREAGLDLANVQGDLKVLDVGAGTGTLSVQVSRRVDASKLTLLDQSEPMLSQARGKSALASTPRNAFVAADAHCLPFEADTFDRVVSSGVIYYFPEPVQALREQLRVVRPGGTVLAMGSLKPKPILVRLIATTFNRFPSEEDYYSWFAQAGFCDIKTRFISNPWNTQHYAIAICGTKLAAGAPIERAHPPVRTPTSCARAAIAFPWRLVRFCLAMAAFAVIGPLQVITGWNGMRRLRNAQASMKRS